MTTHQKALTRKTDSIFFVSFVSFVVKKIATMPFGHDEGTKGTKKRDYISIKTRYGVLILSSNNS